MHHNATKNPHNNLYKVNFSRDPQHGKTVYLPFAADRIHSIVLPGNPAADEPKTFMTANLDGCAIFIDVKQNGDVIVYHANSSTGTAPTAQQSATNPTFQKASCTQIIDYLYGLASAWHNGLGPGQSGPNVAGGQPTFELRKPRYLQNVGARLTQLANLGYTGAQYHGTPEHGSFTTFAGFFTNNRWEFWFQTYSQFYYVRPQTGLKGMVVGGQKTVNPDVSHDDFEIMECVRVYRVP